MVAARLLRRLLLVALLLATAGVGHGPPAGRAEQGEVARSPATRPLRPQAPATRSSAAARVSSTAEQSRPSASTHGGRARAARIGAAIVSLFASAHTPIVRRVYLRNRALLV